MIFRKQLPAALGLIATLVVRSVYAVGPLYMSSAWNEHTYRHTPRRSSSPSSSAFGVSRGGGGGGIALVRRTTTVRRGNRPSSYRTIQPASYRQTSYNTRRRQDYSSKVMDVEEFKKDRHRARLFSVDMKRRRPGQYSWTSRLVMANVICYLIQMAWPRFTQMGIKLSEKIVRGEELYRLLTPVFLHGGVAHLFMNMYSLNNVGPNVENLFGAGRFLSTYLLAGVAGNLASALQSPNPALGASGAVFGMIGAQFVFLTRNDWLLGRAGEQMQSSLFQTILINVFLGAVNPVVDQWGHIGGLVGGAAAAYYFGPRLFLMSLPEGGRCVVDKPVIRLPPAIESIPAKVSKRFKRVFRRIQVNQHTSDLPDKPWRSPKPNYNQRQSVPNRSIKPRRFW